MPCSPAKAATDQNCTDVGLPATTCTSGSCVPSVDDIDITGCSSDTDCDTDTPTCDTTTGTCYYGCNEDGVEYIFVFAITMCVWIIYECCI